MKIKELSLSERPRERLENLGVKVLSDSELLAIILKTGSKNENVLSLSQRLLSNSLFELSKYSLKELKCFKGVGKAKASQILSVFELGRRSFLSKEQGKQIKCAKDVYDYSFPFLKDLDKEQFIILHLNTKNVITKHEVVSIGTLNSSLVHPREVFKSAIKESSNAIILVHNHPSGDPSPSQEDIDITNTLFDAGKLLSIKVLDHVIVGDGFYSFKG